MAHEAAGWLNDGTVPGAILALTVLEAAGIWVLHRLRVLPVGLPRLAPTILAGDFLLLAWLVSARQAPWFVTAGCLAGALVAHGADMAGRVGKS